MQELSNINVIKEILSANGFTFSKSLGQNFLINPTVCPRMAEACGADETTGVIEIGAGIGVLHDYVAAQDRGLTRVLPQVSYERSYWLVTHADAHDLMRVRAVADFIVAEVAAARPLFQLSRPQTLARVASPP